MRLQVPLPGSIPLDDCSQVEALQTAANNFIMNDPAWMKALTWVQKYWV
jgi:hypothetical protein